MKQFVEQRLQKERKAEGEHNAVMKMLKERQIFAGHGEAEHRVEKMRMEREKQELRAEVETEQNFLGQQQVVTKKALVSKMESDLASELERRKAEAIRVGQDKIRMYEGSEDLRNLKGKLHAAACNMERHKQLVEQLLRKELIKKEEEDISQIMEYDRRAALEKELTDKIKKSQQRGKVTAINQQQIILREEAKKESLVQAEEERRQVEEIVKQIQQEDALEEATRKRKQLETQVMLRNFMSEQEERQRKMEQDEIRENEEIEAFAQKKRAQEEAQEREKQRIEEEKRKAYEAIVATAEARNKEAEELEYLRNELYQEELEAQQKRKEELDMRKKLEDRMEMVAACESQLKIKEERRIRAEQEEEEFRIKLLAKFAEDDRIELLNEQKKRQKLMIHKREAERLIIERRAQYEAERQSEIDELARQRVDQERRALQIEAEKRRLLREHAIQYRDYLPKGMFQTKEDHDYVMNFGKQVQN